MNRNNIIWKKILKVLLSLILVLSFLQVKIKHGWDPIKLCKMNFDDERVEVYISKDSIEINRPVSNISLEVFNALQTEGYLCVKNDSNLNVRYCITKNKEIKKNDIEWEKCNTITNSDTLFPKANCLIYLCAKLKNHDKEDSYSEQSFTFDFSQFVNLLIKTGSNNSILHELFSYSYDHTLTICYDNIDEYECKKQTDKGRIENLFLSIRDNEYYVDSVSLHSSTDIKSNIMSNSYPSIKYINCKSKD